MIDATLAAQYEKEGRNPANFRTLDAGATHLRVQSVCGRRFGRGGYVFAHDQEALIDVAELAPHEIHEFLGAHLHRVLRVEQVAVDGRAVSPVAPPVTPPAPVETWTKDQVREKAAALGIEIGNKGTTRLARECRAAEAQAAAEAKAEREKAFQTSPDPGQIKPKGKGRGAAS